MLLKACLNGPRTADEHPALPVTPDQLAADARMVRAAGAGAVHLHVKGADGRDTFDPARVDATLAAVRTANPGLPVGVTTGAWAEPDPARRVAAIRDWTAKPDFASVNWHEGGAEQVAMCLLDKGIGVEAGLWHADAVRAWLASPLRARCFRVLVELPGDLDSDAVPLYAAELLGQLADINVEILLHGADDSCWATLDDAGRHGLATRIGLEDTLTLPDGSRAPDNTALVAAALRRLSR